MHTNTLAVIRAYHQAWTTKQFDTAISLLSSALAVEVPINEYPTAEAFAAALVRFGSDVKHVELLSEMAARDEGMLLYDLDVDWLGRMRVVEHFTVADGKIVRLRQIHDTAALRSTSQQPPTEGHDHRANDAGVKARGTVEQIPDDQGYAAHVFIDATRERVFDALTTVDDLSNHAPGNQATADRGPEPLATLALSKNADPHHATDTDDELGQDDQSQPVSRLFFAASTRLRAFPNQTHLAPGPP